MKRVQWVRTQQSYRPDINRLPQDRVSATTASEKANTSFHLLIPASHSDVNLCKTLLSAAILGYPSPALINWGETYDNSSVLAGGSHAAKLNGVYQYLKELDESHDQDLALVVDGYDIWFQLGPKILIDRYHAINVAANRRFGGEGPNHCDDNFDQEDCTPLQQVVFSAQKDFWPGNDSYDMSCYAVPQSPLPPDMFGQEEFNSLTNANKPKDIVPKKRPRFLNSGTVIGPVAKLRALYERAALQWSTSPSRLGSDQAILADIFRAQEYQRASSHQDQDPHTWKHLAHRLTSRSRQLSGQLNIKNSHPTRQTLHVHPGTRYEFGVGLDYAGSVAQPTIYSENDAQWVRFKNPEEIIHAATKLKISTIRATSLAKDISVSLRPFSTEAGAIEDDVPQPTWDDVPLYTNLWTGITPAIIHHNAWQNDLKSVRETAWERMWFQPYAREMLESRFQERHQQARRLIAVDNSRKAWWSTIDAELSEGEIAWPPNTWEGLCPKEYQDEIFRDGKGLLRSGTDKD